MLGTKTKTDPVQQSAEAEQQQRQLQESIPRLQQEAKAAESERRDAEARRETLEGDALVGTADHAALEKARTEHDAAVTKDSTAQATLRQAVQNLARVNDALARLRPEAQAMQMAAFRAKHEELVRQLRDKLEALIPINHALHEHFRAAEAAFPRGLRTRMATAGLPDLSWTELRVNPFAVNGGKLGTWLKRVELFLQGEPLDVPMGASVRVKPAAAPPTTPRAAGAWQPLPAGER